MPKWVMTNDYDSFDIKPLSRFARIIYMIYFNLSQLKFKMFNYYFKKYIIF